MISSGGRTGQLPTHTHTHTHTHKRRAKINKPGVLKQTQTLSHSHTHTDRQDRKAKIISPGELKHALRACPFTLTQTHTNT